METEDGGFVIGEDKGLSLKKRGLYYFLVETGESRTPRPEEPAQSIYRLRRLYVLASLSSAD